MLPEFPRFQELLEKSEVLMKDRHGLKVIGVPDGQIVKFFRRKRLLSSALWDPYVKRFSRNAGNLKKVDVPTVEVTGMFRVSSLKRDAVVYKRMEGESLRDLEMTGSRMASLAAFFAELHRKGVFFRSVHFGNILELPDGRLGLIDIADMAVKGRGLGVRERIRNFAHLVKYPEDRKMLDDFGIERFIRLYEEAAGLEGWRAKAFGNAVRTQAGLPVG